MLQSMQSYLFPPKKITEAAVTDFHVQGKDKYKRRARTVEEEELFDLVAARHVPKPSGIVASTAQLVKGALGAGVVSNHISFMYAGYAVALVLHALLGVYLTFTFYLLAYCARVTCLRVRMPHLTYSDLGEAAMLVTENKHCVKWSRCFRKWIDTTISIDLFGSCMAYQLIVANGIKQLVENTQATSEQALIPGYPNLRMWVAILIIPFILLVMIRHLDWLAPLSIVANMVVVVCIGFTIYYARIQNPKFQNMTPYKDFVGLLRCAGVAVFTMNCSGVVLAVENNMKRPKDFSVSLFTGMAIIVSATTIISFFGYAAYLDKSLAPITLNFPMTLGPKILKGAIYFMVYITHGLNFWVPFNICFYYVKLHYDEKYHVRIEYLLRAVICFIISLLAIAVPKLANVIALIGTFCLSLMAFIYPCWIYLLVISVHPGFGKFKWRLVLILLLSLWGIFLWTVGTYVNLMMLIKEF